MAHSLLQIHPVPGRQKNIEEPEELQYLSFVVLLASPYILHLWHRLTYLQHTSELDRLVLSSYNTLHFSFHGTYQFVTIYIYDYVIDYCIPHLLEYICLAHPGSEYIFME